MTSSTATTTLKLVSRRMLKLRTLTCSEISTGNIKDNSSSFYYTHTFKREIKSLLILF